MAELGAEPIGDTPAAMARRIQADTGRFATPVKKANVVIA